MKLLTHGLEYSNNFIDNARKIILHQTGTFSRDTSSYVEDIFPSYIKSEKGSHFTDIDKNECLDYLMALGPITLGYNYPAINKAIIEQVHEGILFSLPDKTEFRLSKMNNSTRSIKKIRHQIQYMFEEIKNFLNALKNYHLNIHCKIDWELYNEI